MKKLSIILALVIAFSCSFSLNASAAQTKTEEFFSKVEQNQAICVVPPEIDGAILVDSGETSIRICKDSDGIEYAEIAGSARLLHLEIEMLMTRDKLYMYFPQFGKHIDFSEVYGYKTAQVIASMNESPSVSLMLPAHSDRMYLTYSAEEEIEGLGKVYVEKFSYRNPKAIVRELAAIGEISLPSGTNIDELSVYELSELLISLGGKEADLGFFIGNNEAVFAYNADGNLVACNYYSGDGADLSLEMYSADDCECIYPETNMSKFGLPTSSHSSLLLETLLKAVYLAAQLSL